MSHDSHYSLYDVDFRVFDAIKVALAQLGIRDFRSQSVDVEGNRDRDHALQVRYNGFRTVVFFEKIPDPTILRPLWVIKRVTVQISKSTNPLDLQGVNFQNYGKSGYHLLGILHDTRSRDFDVLELLYKLFDRSTARAIFAYFWEIPTVKVKDNRVMLEYLFEGRDKVHMLLYLTQGINRLEIERAEVEVNEQKRKFLFDPHTYSWLEIPK